MNIFVGNVFAITQQALWGRSLDYLAQNGNIHYRSVIQQGLAKDGAAAFFTVPKWFSRVLMNAPAQGTLPWFYNEVLPMGEEALLRIVKTSVYDPFLKDTYEASTEIAKKLTRKSSQVTDVLPKPAQPQEMGLLDNTACSASNTRRAPL
jgi:hypothetical protein